MGTVFTSATCGWQDRGITGRWGTVFTIAIALAACGGGSATPAASSSTPSTSAASTTTSGTTPGVIEAPEISRSLGADGGIVVLWPRTRADSSADIAGQIQAHLVDVVKRAAPGRAVDVRPAPERVCPRQGCKAIAVGAALLRNGDACAVIATVSAPGPSDATIVPWAGDMQLKSPVAAFREPPESQVRVSDYATCSTVAGALGPRDKDVEAAIKLVAGP